MAFTVMDIVTSQHDPKSPKIKNMFFKYNSCRSGSRSIKSHSPLHTIPVQWFWSLWRDVLPTTVFLTPHIWRRKVLSSRENINLTLSATCSTSAPFINEQCLWQCPLLYSTTIRQWDRRGERQAVKQFPPSESHSDPHSGDMGGWPLPGRQWY